MMIKNWIRRVSAFHPFSFLMSFAKNATKKDLGFHVLTEICVLSLLLSPFIYHLREDKLQSTEIRTSKDSCRY